MITHYACLKLYEKLSLNYVRSLKYLQSPSFCCLTSFGTCRSVVVPAQVTYVISIVSFMPLSTSINACCIRRLFNDMAIQVQDFVLYRYIRQQSPQLNMALLDFSPSPIYNMSIFVMTRLICREGNQKFNQINKITNQ